MNHIWTLLRFLFVRINVRKYFLPLFLICFSWLLVLLHTNLNNLE